MNINIIKSTNCLAIICTMILITGCFSKDVMKDRADELNELVTAVSNGEQFVVAKEEIFQATSKSDKGGMRQITGYVEYRISSYNLQTGELVSRIELGEREDGYALYLGQTDGKLWYKSIDKEIGFHARDPKTLEIIVSEQIITDANPELKDNFSQPEWNQIGQYYGFDLYEKMPMISDNKGFIYYIDPVTLKAEKTDDPIKQIDFDESNTTTSVNINDNLHANLTGDPRKYIRYGNKEFKNISFLKGEFLKSSNSVDINEVYPEYMEPHKERVRSLENAIDSLSKEILLADTSDRFQISRLDWNKRFIERHKKDIETINKELAKPKEVYNIVTSDNGMFVISQTDATDQSKVILSKVIFNKDTTLTKAWDLQLDKIYRHPDKGFDKSSFEVVFSDGNPDLEQMRVIQAGDKLLFMYQLELVCIDTNTGKVLWQREV